MGQMVMIDEDELASIRRSAKYFEYCAKIAEDAEKNIYPHINIWLDTGTNAQVVIAILEKMYSDLDKKKKKWRF